MKYEVYRSSLLLNNLSKLLQPEEQDFCKMAGGPEERCDISRALRMWQDFASQVRLSVRLQALQGLEGNEWANPNDAHAITFL